MWHRYVRAAKTGRGIATSEKHSGISGLNKEQCSSRTPLEKFEASGTLKVAIEKAKQNPELTELQLIESILATNIVT